MSKAKNIAYGIIASILIMTIGFSVWVGISMKSSDEEDSKLLRLIVPENWEMNVGDSRTVDYVFADEITERKLTWSATGGATVDKWGRVTATDVGIATITATNADGTKASTVLNVVANPTLMPIRLRIVNYEDGGQNYGDNLQKMVSRYPEGDPGIPQMILEIEDYSAFQTAVTADGAVWTITDYGVLRTYPAAANERDREQRFMGDRYFFSADTTDGKVLAIAADGGCGIWTVMQEGCTHIEMVELSGADKAAILSDATQNYVSRRGMVSEAKYDSITNTWKPEESDNDGLWTSMYAAGELMRYSVLKSSGASAEEIASARASAMLSTEAVLLLSNISMRKGTTEAYVRYQPNGRYDSVNGRYLSETALELGGDYNRNIPSVSPSDAFLRAYELYLNDGTSTYFLTEEYLNPCTPEDWSDPRSSDAAYEKRTRNLEGYIARTYSFKTDDYSRDGYIYWSFNGDGTATGYSTRSPDSSGYYLNGENLREVTVDASGTIPARLWNDLLGVGYSVEDIIYKGDTSSDEIIGHLFLYKIAYDILGAEDAELKSIISNTMDRFAQHIVDNGYMMVDGSGQPGTWSKFNRDFFYNSSQIGGAPLTAAVLLNIFKVAAYVTGYQKWENEYRMAASDPAYEYAELMTLYSKQTHMMMILTLDDNIGKGVRELLSKEIDFSFGSPTSEFMIRLFLNYSDEEMMMLAFYLLFQMETDETLLTFYRTAIDQWWISMRYSENPLWYYIYQLAYPTAIVKDAYGKNLIDTAAWSLSRHPIDLRKYSASNARRDDIANLTISNYNVKLSYDIKLSNNSSTSMDIFTALIIGPTLTWAVAAPDERSLHKYNGSSYDLHGNYNPNQMEGSTTYTLPYWLGRYHGMLNG
jgi:hypothetical protein